MAKTRLQRRQIFWRSGVSTTSERRRVPTGHGGQTVAQERRLTRSVGASRRSPRARRYQLQALTSVAAARSVRHDARSPNLKRLWTLTQPWTHRTRPPLLGNLAEEREIPTSAHSHSLSFRRTKTKNNDPTLVQIYALWEVPRSGKRPPATVAGTFSAACCRLTRFP